MKKISSDSVSLWYYILVPFSALLATFCTYFPSLHYDFQFDDIANIQRLFDIRHNTFSKLFFSGTRWISYWINAIHYSYGKFDPFSYRLGNIILHSCNGLLVFFMIYQALKRISPQSFFFIHRFTLASITMILFLLHPVQTQTVSYVIQGQLEGFAAFFILAMINCLLWITSSTNATPHASRPSLFGYILFYALAFLSCGTKEIAIISPLLVALVDWFFIAQGNWHSFKQRIYLHLGSMGIIFTSYLYLLKPHFFTEILTLSKVAKNNIGNVVTKDPKTAITWNIFFISQFKVILHYLWIFIWPFSICVEYDWHACESIADINCWLPFLMLCGIAYGIIKLLQKNVINPVAFGALWFFICIAPRSSLIPSPELLVDYKTYTASIGWIFILATALTWLIQKIEIPLTVPRYASSFIAPLILLPITGFFAYQRNLVWSSGEAFWRNIIINAPTKARGYNNLGVELSQNQKKYEESIPYFKKAVALDNNYADPLNNLAVAYSHTGDIDSAITALQHALRINKYYPEGYNNLASFYLQKKEYARAEQSLKNAISLRPHYGKAYFNLGRTCLEQNKIEEAAEYLRKACYEADLDNEFGFSTYAKVCMNLGRHDDAIAAYKKTLDCNPHQLEALFNIGNAHFMKKEFEQSISWYQKCAQLYPHDEKVWYNLGEAYFMLEQPEKALSCFKKMQHKKDEFPHTYLRIAGCYEKMGDATACKKWLSDMIQSPASSDLKRVAQGLLIQVEAKYADNKSAITI